MLLKLFKWVVYHPVKTTILSLVLVLLAGAGITKFDTNHDPRAFFGAENPDFKRFDDMEVKYGARDVVLWAIHPKNGDVFTRENLAIIEELTRKGWEMPRAVRSQSLSNFQHTEVDGDDLFTSYLYENAAHLTDEQLSQIRSIALNEPALLHGAVSTTGHVGAVAVTVVLDDGRRAAPEISQWAEQVRAEFAERYPDVEFYLTGTVVFSEAMSQATRDGLEEVLPLSMVASLLALVILLRSFLGMFFTMAIVSMSVVGALGIGAAMGIVFQPISSYAPAIILTLGIADCIHLLVGFQQQLRLGFDKQKAMVESLRINFQPVFLTSLTTAIGFLCLNTSESPPFADLGNIVAIGVALAFYLSVVLLPALVMIFPAPKLKAEEAWSQRQMASFAELILRRRKSLLLLSSIAMVICAAFIPLNQFNDVWHEYFDDSYAVRRANDFLAQELTGMHRIEFSIPAKDQGGISDPEYLRYIEEFKRWTEAQPEVVYTVNYVDVIKRLNRDMNGGDDAFYRVPDSRELASQYLLMYEMSLPFGLGLDNQMTMDKDQTLFGIILYRTSSSNILEFSKKADAWVKTHFPEYMVVPPSGIDLLFASVAKRNAMSMISGTFGAFLLISFLIMIALKSLKYGLLSLVPNMLPAAMAFGIWGLIDGKVGISVSVVACLTLGIVVDDTVHFLSKYVRAKREQKLNAEEAVRYAFRTVGVALVSTSIILVANFGVMSFSNFYPSSSLGILTAITIFLALVVDFLFLAPFILAIDKRSRDSSDEAGVATPLVVASS